MWLERALAFSLDLSFLISSLILTVSCFILMLTAFRCFKVASNESMNVFSSSCSAFFTAASSRSSIVLLSRSRLRSSRRGINLSSSIRGVSKPSCIPPYRGSLLMSICFTLYSPCSSPVFSADSEATMDCSSLTSLRSVSGDADETDDRALFSSAISTIASLFSHWILFARSNSLLR
uniref:Uncharacterized protein n=1 Tax=Anopheles darlingi TaxID=43151 RepID=A0A2M4D7H2_ANODA